MKKNNIRLLLIVALLIALAAVSFGIARSNKAKAEGQKEQTAEEVMERTEKQQADEEAGPLATVFFASDYQPEAGFDAPADTLRALLKAAKADGKTINRIVICGD